MFENAITVMITNGATTQTDLATGNTSARGVTGGGLTDRVSLWNLSRVLSLDLARFHLHVGRRDTRRMRGVCKRMIVQCAICGFIEMVEVAYDWKKGKDRVPKLWICDVHRVEWINRVEE